MASTFERQTHASRSLIAPLILIGMAVAPAAAAPRRAATLCTPDGGTTATVTAVDSRLELTLGDGSRLKIAGIDPPQPTPHDPYLSEKSRAALAGWLVGHPITFRPLAKSADRWGRLPALAFGAPAPGAPQRLSIGAALLDAGLARFEPIAQARACDAGLAAYEAGARKAELGLWADPYYAVIAATDGSAFADKAGGSVIVEGRLSGVETGRFRTKLVFGPRRGRDFAITIVQRNVKKFVTAGLDFHALIGQSFRVRGLLDTRFGPEIEITSPDEIERIDAGATDPTTAPGVRPPLTRAGP